MSNIEKIPQSTEPVLVDVVEKLQKYLADSQAEYPRDLINQIVEQREHETEKLLVLVDKFFTYLVRDITDGQWMESIVAFFILSKFREKRLFPYAVRLCEIPHNTREFALGDVATEHVPEFLASSFNGDWETLYALVTNYYLDEYLRGGIIELYVIFYRRGLMSREQILKVFSNLFVDLYDDYSLVPTLLVSGCCDIVATELTKQIENYFANDIVKLDFISRENVDEYLSRSHDEALEELEKYSVFDFIDDLEKDMGWMFKKRD